MLICLHQTQLFTPLMGPARGTANGQRGSGLINHDLAVASHSASFGWRYRLWGCCRPMGHHRGVEC